MTAPYIPLYIDDYDAATAHLTAEEDGVYLRLLRLTWRTPGCSLPTDHAWIARKIRLSIDDYERVAKPILAEFFSCLRGRFVQKRLREEWAKYNNTFVLRSKAGRKGVAAKALKNKETGPSPAYPGLKQPEPEPEPEEKSSEDKSSDGGAVVDFDQEAWKRGVDLLTQAGAPEKSSRAFLGKLLSINGLEARDLLPAIMGASVRGTQDPQSYLTKSAAGIAKRRFREEPKRVGFV